jgi:anti-sigma B factor antagonist
MTTPFTVEIATDDEGTVVVRVVGDIDVETAPRLEDAIDDAAVDGRTVVLDMTDVSFIDSSGLNAMLQLRARHPALSIGVMSQPVRRLLDITGVTGFFVGPPA